MIETINPVVHGGSRSDYRKSIALHSLGATVSAGLLGAALGSIGALLRAPWGDAGLLGVAVVAIAYAARELLGIPVPLLDRKRQVPDWWRTFYSPPVAALLYGVGLGVGFLTFITFGTLVAVAAASVASGDPLVGALMCAPFGAARAAAVALAVATDRAHPADVVDRLETVARSRAPGWINGAALTAIAATSGWLR